MINARKYLALLFTVAVIASPQTSLAAQKKYKLTKGAVQKVGSVQCGLLGKSWKVVKKVKKNTYIENRKASKKQKNICKRLLKKGAFSSFAQLPSIAKLAAENSASNKSSFAMSMVGATAVSGTPPTILEIATGGPIKNTFWTSGVIDAINGGTPSHDQCSELFGGDADGESSGLAGCYLTQSVGYSFQNALTGATSLCYMKSMGNSALFNSGAITVTDGQLPGNDPSRILEAGDSSERITRVNVTGFVEQSAEEGPSESIFIKVASKSDNNRKGNQYSYSIFFCGDGPTPVGVESGSISLAGKLTALSSSGEPNERFSSKITAFLTLKDGAFVFDPTQERTAEVSSVRSNDSFKSNLTINADNEIRAKEYNVSGPDTRFGYSISRFTGSSFGDLRFLEGASKNSNSGSFQGNFSAAIEFRDSFYASAPASQYFEELSSVNFNSDPFYQSAPSVPTPEIDFDCTAEADVTLSMDFSHPALQAVAQECEGERINGMDFCRSDNQVQSAEQNYREFCMGNNP